MGFDWTPGYGIGSLVVGGTAGSVLFVDNNTKLAQDNTNFKWDDTNDILTVADLIGSNLTANRLISANGSKQLTSVANLASWISGTTNQITVTDDGDGTVTLAAPQDLHTAASPTFAGLTLNASGLVAQLGTDPSIISIGASGSAEPNCFVGSWYDATSNPNSYFSSNLYYNGSWIQPDATKNTGMIEIRNGDISFYTGTTGFGGTYLRLHKESGLALGASYVNTDPGADNFIMPGKMAIGTNVLSTVKLQINAATATNLGLLLRTTDDNTTQNIFQVQDSLGNVQILFTPTGGATFNEEGNDSDIRFEGLTDVNLLFLDAGNDRVAIGHSVPSYKFDIGISGLTSKLGTDPSIIGIGNIGSAEPNAFIGCWYDATSTPNAYFSSNVYYNGSWIQPDGTKKTGMLEIRNGDISFYTGVTSFGGVYLKLFNQSGLSLGNSYSGTDPGADNFILPGKIGCGTNSLGANKIQVNAATATNTALLLKSTDNSATKNLFDAQDSSGNSLAKITGVGDLIFTGGGGLSFAEVYGYDTNTTITISGTGKANKVQITAFDTNGVSNNMTPDHTNDHITVTSPGMYLCTASISAESSGGGGADEVGFSVWKNNGATEFQNLHTHRKLAGGGGDVGSMSLSGIIDLAANDTIEIWTWNEDSTDDLVIDDITLSLVQVGGT